MDLIIFVVVLVILIFIGRQIWIAVQRRKSNEHLESMFSQQQAFLEQHPDAARLYYQSQNKSRMLDVSKVNGVAPERFIEGRRQGIFLLPGKNYDLDLQCEERSGSLRRRHNTKSVYTDVTRLAPSPKKTYELKFDKETKQFSISQSAPAGNRK